MCANRKNKNLTKLIKFWLPVLVCMGFIFYFSSIPATDIPSLFPFQDVLFHIVIYAITAYFFARALKNTYSKLSSARVVYITVFFGIIYGLSDEFHQIFVTNRCASGFDLFIDGVGSFMGSLSHTFLLRSIFSK